MLISPLLRRSCIGTVLALIVLAATVGCGEGKVRVRGVVTFDGKPIDHGVITLDPADGHGPNTGGEIVAGHYDLSAGARSTPGKKIVRILAFRATGRKIESGPPAPPGTLVDEIQPYIPTRYNDHSILSAEIVPSKVNEVNFDLLPAQPAR